jgi:alpha-D-ribose 1-methylphosphonate 5-triphosphate synthase subunit PhnH
MISQSSNAIAAPGAGLNDPVMEGQAVFRAVMAALAEPGTIRPLDDRLLAALDAPAPLLPASAAIVLALADFETPIWLDDALSTPEITSYVRFHAGCPLTENRADASFAVIADGADLDTLAGFAVGSLEYPDRSTTLIVQVMSLTHGARWHLRGPGIATVREVHISPVHPALVASLQTNRAAFPCGVDLIFTDGKSVLGLPRSSILTEA